MFHVDQNDQKSFLILYGGAAAYAPNTAAAPQIIRVLECPPVSISLENCTWSSPTIATLFSQSFSNRFAHRVVYNPVSEEILVAGGMVASSMTNAVMLGMSMPTSSTSSWMVRNVSIGSDRGRASMYQSLTVWRDQATDISYIIRFGGVDQNFPQTSPATFKSSLEFRFFFSGRPSPLPPYVPPVANPTFTQTATSPTSSNDPTSTDASTEQSIQTSSGTEQAGYTTGLVAGSVLAVIGIATVAARRYPDRARKAGFGFLV